MEIKIGPSDAAPLEQQSAQGPIWLRLHRYQLPDGQWTGDGFAANEAPREAGNAEHVRCQILSDNGWRDYDETTLFAPSDLFLLGADAARALHRTLAEIFEKKAD